MRQLYESVITFFQVRSLALLRYWGQRLLSLALLGFTTAGCTHSVRLRVPPKSASLAKRTRAYNNIKLTSDKGLIDNQPGTSWNYLVLENGIRVYAPADLLPVVPQQSVTARNIKSFYTNKTNHGITTATTTIAGIVGGGFLATLLTAGFISLGGAPSSALGPMYAISGTGTVVFGAGFIASLVLMNRYGEQMVTARRDIRFSYDRDLRKKLGLKKALKNLNP